jgi:hypothetical protein
MRKRALVMAGAIALTVMASTRVARAQDPLVVNIPFDFVAGTTKLPAGEYAIKVSGPQNTLLLINRTDAANSAFINTNAAVANEQQVQSKLIFNRYGDSYFLSQVWTAGNVRGRQLLKAAREKEIARTARFDDQSRVALVAELPPITR